MATRKLKRTKKTLLVPALLLATAVLSLLVFHSYWPREKVTFDPKDYFVFRSFPLFRARDGFDGKLELLFDKKLEKEKGFAAMEAAMNAQEEEDHLREREGKEEDEDEQRMAALCLFDLEGKVKEVHLLDHAVASFIGRVELYGDGTRVYPVEMRYKAGTNDRTETQLVELKDGHLAALPLTALYDEQDPQLRVANSWQWAPARSGKGADILVFNRVQLGGEGHPIEATYTRYFFDGVKWVQKNKVVQVGTKVDWDSFSSRFPDASLFP